MSENGTSKRRDDFLLSMYRVFWDNISRSEDAAWKMFAAYSALFVGLTLSSSVLGLTGFLILLTLFSLLSMCTVVNSNLWFVRNLCFIGNLEAEFLNKGDYGIILPYIFKGKAGKVPFLNSEKWWIFFFVYLAIPIASLIFLFDKLPGPNEKLLSVLVLSIGISVVLVYSASQKVIYDITKDQAPGKY